MTVGKLNITGEMTLLDIVSEHPMTVSVFKSYDQQTGECLCCQRLFETVEAVSAHYKLDLTKLLKELNSVANQIDDH